MFRRHFGTTFRWKVLGKLGQVWQNFGQTDVALDASCIFWRRLGLWSSSVGSDVGSGMVLGVSGGSSVLVPEVPMRCLRRFQCGFWWGFCVGSGLGSGVSSGMVGLKVSCNFLKVGSGPFRGSDCQAATLDDPTESMAKSPWMLIARKSISWNLPVTEVSVQDPSEPCPKFPKFPNYPNFPKHPYTSLRDHPKPKEHEGYLLQLKSSEQQLRRRSSAASEAAPGRAERKTTGHAEHRDSREAAKGSETCFKIGWFRISS